MLSAVDLSLLKDLRLLLTQLNPTQLQVLEVCKHLSCFGQTSTMFTRTKNTDTQLDRYNLYYINMYIIRVNP